MSESTDTSSAMIRSRYVSVWSRLSRVALNYLTPMAVFFDLDQRCAHLLRSLIPASCNWRSRYLFSNKPIPDVISLTVVLLLVVIGMS